MYLYTDDVVTCTFTSSQFESTDRCSGITDYSDVKLIIKTTEAISEKYKEYTFNICELSGDIQTFGDLSNIICNTNNHTINNINPR